MLLSPGPGRMEQQWPVVNVSVQPSLTNHTQFVFVCMCVCVFSLNVLFMARGSWVEAFKPDHSPPLTFYLTPPVITSLRTSSSSTSLPCLLPLKSVWNVNGYSRGKYPTPHSPHTVCSLKFTLFWVPVALFSDVTLKILNMQVLGACFLAPHKL